MDSFKQMVLTCAAIAALDRASSLPPCCGELSPSVRPGVFCQFALAGTEARGAVDCPDGGAPTTRPGPAKASGSFDEREQILPMVFVSGVD
jgi:hypothetical protein